MACSWTRNSCVGRALNRKQRSFPRRVRRSTGWYSHSRGLNWIASILNRILLEDLRIALAEQLRYPLAQMKLRMKREALEKLNRRANEMVSVREADAFSIAPLCTEVLQ